MNTRYFKTIVWVSVCLLLVADLFGQLEIDGGNPGINVINAIRGGIFEGVTNGITGTNSIVGIGVEGIDQSGSANGQGVRGFSTKGKGVSGDSDSGLGIFGHSNSFYGVWGDSESSIGVQGTSDSGIGGYFKSDSVAAKLKGHLKMESLANQHEWQVEINSALNDGYLLLFYNGIFKGSFNSSNGNYASVSDRAFKEDITGLSAGALEQIMNLRPVSYLMKDESTNERQHGCRSRRNGHGRSRASHGRDRIGYANRK